MSLDVYLIQERLVSYDGGNTWHNDPERIYDANITHNLNKMAGAAGIYEALWRPYKLKPGYENVKGDDDAEWEFETQQVIRAKEITELLRQGLADLIARPDHFEQFNSPNGWGTYEHFVPFVARYLQACENNPDALVQVSR